jgi:multisubunit Na+/H+ antiporter MnhB subunit
MPKHLITVVTILLLLAVDWLTFHDLFEPHTVRDYLTLAASLLVFLYIGLDVLRRDNSTVPRSG